MRDKRESFDQRCNFFPYIRKHRGVFRIFRSQAMHLPAEPLVIFRFRMDKAVEAIYDLSVAYDHYSYAAYAGPAFVCRLEIYCCKIFHSLPVWSCLDAEYSFFQLFVQLSVGE